MTNDTKTEGAFRSTTSALATLLRWRDVFLYAVLGAIAARVVAARVAPLGAPWAANIPILAAVVLLLTALVSIVLLHKIAGTRLGHIRYVHRYPPLPIAVVLGIFLVGVGEVAVNKRADWRAIGALELLYCATWAAQILISATWHRLVRRATSDSRADSANQNQQSDEQLLAWIERESPISDSASDLFAHQIIAERLLRRLSQGETTIALLGAFGSGKSSIGRLAASLAEARRLPLVFAEVSCWGFGESLDAQEELLTQVIRRVSQHVDTFALRNLPAEYVGAMGSHLGLYGTALRIINGKRSPERVLQQLSPILSVIRKRVVLFIEDADRNFATFDMTRLESLLMRLREIPGLSFVLCISPTQKVDLSRLCERTEMVPELDQGTTLQLIERTRDILLRQYPIGIMLDRLEGLVAEGRDVAMLEGVLGYYWPPQYTLPALAASPRTLKRILRRVVEAWPDLCGEVTIDDLIRISVLREGAPEAFAFFRRNHRLFRASLKEHKDITETARTKLKESLSEEWHRVVATGTFDARSAAWLMKDIYPDSAAVTGLFASHVIRHQSMQSERRGGIYARRLISEMTFGDEISDQRIFELLSKAQSDDATLAELAEAITDSNFASDAFEEFAHAFEFDRFLPLLSQVYRIIRERHGCRLSREDHPGFFAPWRLIMYDKPEGFEQWLAAELRLCIPKHLRLMTDIYYFFVGADRHTLEEREPYRRAILSALKDAWTSIPAVEIAEGFDASHSYTLFQILFTSDYERPETVPFNQIEDWAWSGPYLIAAAQAAPSVMLPQIIHALNSMSNRGREVPRFTLDKTLFDKWFGDEGAVLFSLITKGFDPPPDLDPQARYLVTQAIEQMRAQSFDPAAGAS